MDNTILIHDYFSSLPELEDPNTIESRCMLFIGQIGDTDFVEEVLTAIMNQSITFAEIAALPSITIFTLTKLLESKDSLFNLALKGGEGKLGFLAVAEQYSGTAAGNLANYHAGMAYLNLGDFKNAITYLEKFKSDDAISYYKKAAEASENDFTTPRYLLKAAQLYLTAGKKAEAHKLFVEIKEKYETSKEGMNIDAFIAMTE